MPTYQYACTGCGHEFDAVQSFSEPALTECPQCEGRLRKVFSAVGVVFKGSGFYRTDSRASSTKAASKGSDAKPSDSSSSSSTSQGKDSSSTPASSSSTSTPNPAGSKSTSKSGSTGTRSSAKRESAA